MDPPIQDTIAEKSFGMRARDQLFVSGRKSIEGALNCTYCFCGACCLACYAVLIFAASSNPNVLMARSRSTNFCTLPLAVRG